MTITHIKSIIFFANSSRDLFDYISLISSIAVPFIIYYLGVRLSKNQEKKILKDNEINRLANYHSSILLDKNTDKSFIILHIKTWHNYTESIPYINILLSNKNNNINGTIYAITINLAFKSIGKIIPNSCQVSNISLFDTTIYKTKQSETEQLLLDFKNYTTNFRNVSIDENELVNLTLLCCITDEEYKKLESYNPENKTLNFNMDFKIKNQFGIISDCTITGNFTHQSQENVGANSLGGEKEKWKMLLNETSLQIKSTYEEKDN